MRTFKIEVKETLSRVVKVKSNSITNALSVVNKKYDKAEIVLDYNDLKTLDIDLLELKNVENSPIFSDFLLKNAENMIKSLSLEELAIIAFGSLNEAVRQFDSD
jgi:hypothetical protein